MQTVQKRYTAVAGVLSAILTTTCWSHDLVPPCWRDTGGSTFQRWTFNTNDNPASPELNHNSYGSPQASITLGPFGSGWQWDLGFGTNRGYWDLGSNGSITLSIPNDPTAPAGAWKYVWVQMTYWDDPPLFVAPAVSVSGATLLATSNLVVEQTFMGRWSLQQTLWRLDSSPNAETVTLTAAANGGVVDQVVVDTKWIKIDCPADLVFEADPGQCSKANVTYVGLPEVDGCVVTNVSCSPPNGSTFPVGTTPVSCIIWDGGGKTVNCSFTVTVNDTQAPVATCPQDITVPAAEGQCSAIVTYSASASDNCPGASISCDPPSGSSFPVGQTTVTCTATDAAGNHATCSFTVTVNDTQAPVATCPQDITVPAAEGQCSAIVTYSASASDNCPGASISCDPPSGSSFPVGQTTVTCTATDAAGNHATCSFTVTVTDEGAPVLGLITATQQQPGGTVDVKDCANPTLVGTVHITVQASDACGLAGPPTVELKLGSEIQIATFVEENPAGTFNYTWEVTDQTANGTWTATVTAEDGAGNKTTANFTLCVSVRLVTGVVQYSTLSEASYSVAREVVFAATDAQGTVLRRWTVSLTFQNNPDTQSASATYVLTDVPADTANLSAKTAWHLRKRLPVAFGQSGQAQVNFELLGGDLNGSNTTDIYDYATLRNNWLTSNAQADINGDGQVQLLDYSILREDWYRAGDPE